MSSYKKMPIYKKQCLNQQCLNIDEIIKSYKEAQEHKCLKCNSETKFIPTVPGGVIINGFSAANGYHRETINYDGKIG